QGMIGFSIDEFLRYYGLKVPNHIKIDVDGLEKDILSGAKETLRDPRLKSVLVEIDEEDEDTSNAIITLMKDAGFSVKVRAHSEMVENSERYNKVFNYIFSK
ncbi:MAG: FkbM family methyltransferase, partial [Methanomicrobium sp.]|nr:FkbM family methyltransferase [Methanomicrobium sp.]